MATAAMELLFAGNRIGHAQSDMSAFFAVAYDDPGRQIAADFIGLSCESAILADDELNASNSSLLGLIRLLGRKGVIRIGGNTSERTVWRADANSTASSSFVITPASIDRLAACLRELGWKVIYGLNLARGTPEEAAAEAAYVSHALGDNLLAFQIGNEPDGFGRWTAVRPDTYDAMAFLREWRSFHAAIRARLPQARFAGPDTASEIDWVAALAEQRPDRLILLTHHYYAEGPAGAPHVTIANLLNSDSRLAPVLEKLALYGRKYSLPYRVVETNSVYNEGQPGVSDTLAAALWGLELMLEVAAAGAAGVNFHAGAHNLRPAEDKAYSPIARNGPGQYRATPIYYAMLAFALFARGALLPARLAPPSSHLKAFAVRAPQDNLHVFLINKNLARDVRVAIDPGRHFHSFSIARLVGPSVDASRGITLGGSGVDELGAWSRATPQRQRVAAGGEIAVAVPAASAAVVSMHA